MWKRLTLSHAAILIAAVIVAACGSDQALLVSPHVDDAPPLGVVADPAGAPVSPVQRDIALSQDESWSFDVGPSGTSVRHVETGLTITVPAGAVSAPTHITVIALEGVSLAYRFEPHGLQFARPIQLTQSLRGLKLNGGSSVPALFAGYFSEDALATDALTGEARVHEILPIQIDVRGHSAIFSVRHFSGYTVASADHDTLSLR
jgi:hypothetical protein